MQNEIFYLSEIAEIVETNFYTSAVRDAIPGSLLLVADSGTAKSKMILRYGVNGIIHLTDSFSAKGLFDLMEADKQKKIRFLVVPDMNLTLSRKQSTVESAVANLLSLTSDGTCRVDDGRHEKVSEHDPVGFVSACTPDMYEMRTKKWFALGLRRRIIPLFYTYTDKTIRELLQRVREDKITGKNFNNISVNFPAHNLSPVISAVLSVEIESIAVQLSQNLGKFKWHKRTNEGQFQARWGIKKIIPISPSVTLKTLARGHAIRDKRAVVNKLDIDFLARFIAYTDPEAPRQV